MPPTIREQVEDRIQAVTGAYTTATRKVESNKNAFLGAFGLDESKDHALGGLRGLKPNLDAWVSRGRTQVVNRMKTNPAAGAGWIRNGESMIEGFEEIAQAGLDANLKNLEVTIEGVKNDAEKIGRAGTQAVKAVGSVGLSIIKPFLPWIVGAAVVLIGGRMALNRLTK